MRRWQGGAAALAWLALAWSAAAAPPSPTDRARATELNNQGVTAAHAGQFEDAAATLRQAAALDPTDHVTRKNLSAVLTDWALRLEQHNRLTDAEAALREAAALDPDNGAACAALGDLLYLRHSDLDGAIRAWERAYGRVSSEQWRAVAARLTQAKRDRVIEQRLDRHTTAHFDIRSQQALGEALPLLSAALERGFEQLAAALGGTPPRINVIVYAGEELSRVYAQRDWAIGFYDGRIRVRAEDIREPYFNDVIVHELAHAFLHQLYGQALPTWVHEGYAQSLETPEHLAPELAQMEARVRDRTQWIPLKWLDRRFEQPSSSEDVMRAYAEARHVVRRLITQRGMPAFRGFLQALKQGTPLEHAFDAAFAPLTWANADAGKLD